MDLAAGLTRMSWRKYFLVVLLGSPLRIFWLQYILAGVGQAVFNPETISRFFALNPGVLIFSFIYFILAVLVLTKVRIKE